jgi:glycosyltransferase involved in cell wall biosynthesis
MVNEGAAVRTRIGIFFLSFGENIFAGIENSLYNLALGLINHGVEVHVYTGFLSGDDDRIGQISIYRSRLLPDTLPEGDDTVRRSLLANRLEIIDEIVEFVRNRRITHLFVCDPLWGIIQPTKAWKQINLPIILSLHVLNRTDLLTEALQVPYVFYRVVSDSLKQQILAQVKLERLITIPNSIDLSRFYPDPNGLPLSGPPVIFCNARIAPEKGIIFLVQSFAPILKRFPDAELWLCGGEFPFDDQVNYPSQIRETIRALGIQENIRILPKLEWVKIPEIIRRSHLVVIPSLRETFGRGALEAMACGKPVVVSNVDNFPHLVQDAGLLVAPESRSDIELAIIRLITDETLSNALGRRGVQLAAQYSNEVIAGTLLREINQI